MRTLLMMPSKENSDRISNALVPAGASVQRLDATLLLIARGDSEALGRLYDSTSAIVYALAERLMRDPFQAEEAVLDVFRYVWERASQYDPKRGTVRAWLLTITRGRALDRLRKTGARRAREVAFPEVGERSDGLVEPGKGPDGDVMARERHDALETALAALPPKQRTAIELAFFHAMTHEAIASQTGEPLGTIKSQIRRGLLRLHELLGDKEVEQ